MTSCPVGDHCPTVDLGGTCELVEEGLTMSLRSCEPLASQEDEDRCAAMRRRWIPGP